MRQVVVPTDMVDNSAGLLDRAPGPARLAPARVSSTPIWCGYAVNPVAALLIVDRCASFACACSVGVPRPRNGGFPSNHAEYELSTASRGNTAPVLPPPMYSRC